MTIEKDVVERIGTLLSENAKDIDGPTCVTLFDRREFVVEIKEITQFVNER